MCHDVKMQSISWKRCNVTILDSYAVSITETLDEFGKPSLLTPRDIDTYYDTIAEAITSASYFTLPKSKFNQHAKPYWSQQLKHLHSLQRHARRLWVEQGRPRGNQHAS